MRRPDWRGPLGRSADRIMARARGSLWPLPVFAIILAVTLGVGMPLLDEVLQGPGTRHPLTFAFGGGPSAARDVLTAISGSLISVTGLTFSFTVVALQLASSQHSPRFLQTFVTDRVVQSTLALLVGTFVYALTVLRTVRTEESAGPAFVPRLSVTVGFALTLASVVGLVLFLGHLARSLRVETMLRDVSEEARQTYAGVLHEQDGDAADRPLPTGPAIPVTASRSGFLTDVDGARLAAAAARADATVVLAARIGDSVVAGTPLAHVRLPSLAGTEALDELQRALHRCVSLGYERRPDQDVAYSLRKVVDIAVRALSPGTNDPTTAVHALSHVSALLGELLRHPLAPVPYQDADGVIRVLVPQWDAAALVRLGLEEPVHFAEGQPAVLRRLAGLLRELAWQAPAGRLDEQLQRYLERVIRAARGSADVDEAETVRWRQDVTDALAGTWASWS